jgi:hypothetical protein
VLPALGGVAIATPLGRLSVNDVIVAALALALLNVIAFVESAPAMMPAGVKIELAPTPALPAATTKDAVEAAVLLPPLVTKAPAASVLA